ncbi:MAG: aminotransferase class III-fold pyridoxal phosphate-dependent enzyme, partial [Candidatus Bathyarchaeia archaeon]
DIITGEGLPERASRLGLRLMEGLLALKEKHNAIREVRGMGLMIGVEMKHDVYNVIMKSLEKGLLILDAGKNVLRFLPPLVIEEAQLDRAIRILDEAIEDVAGGETGGRLPDRVTQGV